MRRRVFGGKLTAIACGISALILASAPSANAAPVRALDGSPSLGISFIPDNPPTQCEGPQEQWTDGANWSEPIRIDTDNRGGGCRLAFSVYDPDGAFAGLRLFYNWAPSEGGDAGQCGNVVGQKRIPIVPFEYFPTAFRIDSDGRAGWCDLTFSMTGRNDVALDVRYYADAGGDANQCVGAVPVEQPRIATSQQAVTIGVDTDNRPGGCWLSLRLRQF